MAVEFNDSDYLAIVPYAWARSKTARQAYQAALGNMPGAPYVTKKADAPVMIWRLSDAVDQVEVNDMGGFSYHPGEGRDKADMGARLVWHGKCNTKPAAIPESLIDRVEKA